MYMSGKKFREPMRHYPYPATLLYLHKHVRAPDCGGRYCSHACDRIHLLPEGSISLSDQTALSGYAETSEKRLIYLVIHHWNTIGMSSTVAFLIDSLEPNIISYNQLQPITLLIPIKLLVRVIVF